jgi:MerC mercury resistance protein
MVEIRASLARPSDGRNPPSIEFGVRRRGLPTTLAAMPAERTSVAQCVLPQLSALDRLGAASSILCAIHCLITPFVLAALPFLGLQMVLGESLEWTFIVAGLAIGTLTLIPAFRRVHGRLLPLMLFTGGVSLWFAARLGPSSESILELPTMVAGSFSVVSAHLVNRRLCRACGVCADVRGRRAR